MSSGGHRSPTAFILWPFSPSKKSPLDPPSPWGWLGAYEYDKYLKTKESCEAALSAIISELQTAGLSDTIQQNKEIQIRNQNGGAWTPDDSSGSSFRHFREDMLDYSKTEGPEKPVYDILIKAKLLRLPAE